MELNTLTTILVACVPSISAVLAILADKIASRFSLKKWFSNQEDKSIKRLEKVSSKLEKAYDDLAILKTKIASIEKYLVEKQKKKG